MSTLAIRLADTIMKRHPDPLTIPYKPWCYVHGYVLDGFDRLAAATGDRRYADYLLKYVDSHVSATGALPVFTGESLDDMMAGTAIVSAFRATGRQRYRVAATRVRRAFDDYPRNADGGFWHARNLPHEMWIDGAFMGQMFLLRYGAAIGEAEVCFDEAVRQLSVQAERLRKGTTGLFHHGYDEARRASWADRATGLSSDVWSEGLGWFALVLTEAVAILPAAHPGRTRVLAILEELLEGLARVQDPRSGLWYQVVDKGDRPGNWHDTSGSAMFTYAVQRSVELGIAERERFGAVAARGWEGVRGKTAVGADGGLDVLDACDGVCVQDGYDAYINYPRVVNAKEAVGGVLWAATIMEHGARGWGA